MKSTTSNPNDFNIYCTDADSTNHRISPVSAGELLRQIKVCSLLGKYVYISGGHIFENSETVNLLMSNPDLLESGIVAIGLRDDCRDFDDLLEMQKSLGKSFIQNYASLPRFLNSKTSIIMRWHAPYTQPRFKRFLLSSITNRKSILRRRLTGVATTAIRELEKELQELDPKLVTREALQRLVRKHIPNQRPAFMREVNLLYYIAGSGDRIPHLSDALFSDLSHGYIESLDYEKYPIQAENLFTDFLKNECVSAQIIDQMSVSGLAQFREKHSEFLERFRSKWWSTIGVGDPSVSGACNPEDFQELQSLIVEELSREKGRLRNYNGVARTIGISSLLFSAASLIPSPVISAISFLMSCGAYVAESDALKHKVLGTHFIALTSRLQTSYKDKQAQ